MPTVLTHPSLSTPQPAPDRAFPSGRRMVKILVTGGFGVGKTTMIASVSEIAPLTTDVAMTEASLRLDDTSQVPEKTATTVVMDFGRISIDDDVVLYLYGTPGQKRFWFMWDQLARGALGAVVLADVRRFCDCFPAIDYVENCGLPYAVVVNEFDDAPTCAVADIRDALSVGPHVPILSCDARQRAGAKQVLIALVEHVAAATTLRRVSSRAPPPPRLFVGPHHPLHP